MGTCISLVVLMTILRFFQILSNFPRKFGQKFSKLRNKHFQGARWRSPHKLGNLLKTVEKSMKTSNYLKSSMNSDNFF